MSVRLFEKVLVLALFVLVPLTAEATIIDTFPDWTGDTTSGWLFTAQTITAPTDTLASYEFGIAPRVGAGSVGFSIYAWIGASPVGPALYSASAPWDNSTSSISFTGINLVLNPGSLYGMVIDLQGYGGQSVHFLRDAYAGGNGLWSSDGINWTDFPDLDHRFRAEFVPEPSTLVLLGVGLLVVGRRRWSHRR